MNKCKVIGENLEGEG